jgi:hypothetical protein
MLHHKSKEKVARDLCTGISKAIGVDNVEMYSQGLLAWVKQNGYKKASVDTREQAADLAHRLLEKRLKNMGYKQGLIHQDPGASTRGQIQPRKLKGLGWVDVSSPKSYPKRKTLIDVLRNDLGAEVALPLTRGFPEADYLKTVVKSLKDREVAAMSVYSHGIGIFSRYADATRTGTEVVLLWFPRDNTFALVPPDVDRRSTSYRMNHRSKRLADALEPVWPLLPSTSQALVYKVIRASRDPDRTVGSLKEISTDRMQRLLARHARFPVSGWKSDAGLPDQMKAPRGDHVTALIRVAQQYGTVFFVHQMKEAIKGYTFVVQMVGNHSLLVMYAPAVSRQLFKPAPEPTPNDLPLHSVFDTGTFPGDKPGLWCVAYLWLLASNKMKKKVLPRIDGGTVAFSTGDNSSVDVRRLEQMFYR